MIDHNIDYLLLQKAKIFCQSGTEITKKCAFVSLFLWNAIPDFIRRERV